MPYLNNMVKLKPPFFSYVNCVVVTVPPCYSSKTWELRYVFRLKHVITTKHVHNISKNMSYFDRIHDRLIY